MNAVVLRALEKALPQVVRDAPFGELTTYRVGGRAAAMVTLVRESEVRTLDEVLASLREVGSPVAVYVLGKGSNTLVADRGFDGVVVRLGRGLEDLEVTGTRVEVGGAASGPVVARRMAARGLAGLAWLVGVPGSIGGAVRMNAGGHGHELAESLEEALVWRLGVGTGPAWRGRDALALGYRRSAIGPDDVVLRARVQLVEGDREEEERVIAEIVRWRRAHQPGGQNAGSVFANPNGVAAAALIEGCGLKGLRIGTAEVSPKHANFIQADPGGRADDVRALMERVREEVHAQTGYVLATEVRLVGFEEVGQ
jgi:UDP-N-acetylmuramate dehydrogenase